jgi:hypothetical protein
MHERSYHTDWRISVGTPPAMVLSVQPASRDLMNKRSRPVGEGLFTTGASRAHTGLSATCSLLARSVHCCHQARWWTSRSMVCSWAPSRWAASSPWSTPSTPISRRPRRRPTSRSPCSSSRTPTTVVGCGGRCLASRCGRPTDSTSPSSLASVHAHTLRRTRGNRSSG